MPEPGRPGRASRATCNSVRFDDIRDVGESVLALGEMQTTGQTTQLVFNGELAQLAKFRDGKVVSFRDFGSHADALEAAGLSDG